MPMTVPLLAVLLGLAFYLGLIIGAGLALWRLPYRLAHQDGELESLAIRVLETHKRRLQRQARRQEGRHLRTAEEDPPT